MCILSVECAFSFQKKSFANHNFISSVEVLAFPRTLLSLIKSNATCNKFACRAFPVVRINPFSRVVCMQILAANCPGAIEPYHLWHPESCSLSAVPAGVTLVDPRIPSRFGVQSNFLAATRFNFRQNIRHNSKVLCEFRWQNIRFRLKKKRERGSVTLNSTPHFRLTISMRSHIRWMANKTGENFHLGEYCETIGLHNPLTQIALNQKLCFAQIKRKDAGEDEVATQEIATPCGHKSHLVKY